MRKASTILFATQGKLRGTPSDEEDTLGDLKTFKTNAV